MVQMIFLPFQVSSLYLDSGYFSLSVFCVDFLNRSSQFQSQMSPLLINTSFSILADLSSYVYLFIVFLEIDAFTAGLFSCELLSL